MGYEDLKKMESRFKGKTFSENTQFKGKSIPGETYAAKGTYATKKQPQTRPGFHLSNFKVNAGKAKNIAQKGITGLGNIFPGLKDPKTIDRIAGPGFSLPQQHRTTRKRHKSKSSAQHIYIHHIQGGKKKKRTTSRSSNPFDLHW